jgi:hypothetical protein
VEAGFVSPDAAEAAVCGFIPATNTKMRKYPKIFLLYALAIRLLIAG